MGFAVSVICFVSGGTCWLFDGHLAVDRTCYSDHGCSFSFKPELVDTGLDNCDVGLTP